MVERRDERRGEDEGGEKESVLVGTDGGKLLVHRDHCQGDVWLTQTTRHISRDRPICLSSRTAQRAAHENRR